jgi:hypothetical protein
VYSCDSTQDDEERIPNASVFVHFTAGFGRPMNPTSRVSTWYRTADVRSLRETRAEYEHRCSAGLMARGTRSKQSVLCSAWVTDGRGLVMLGLLGENVCELQMSPWVELTADEKAEMHLADTASSQD